jgi:dTDP-glucose 4,6-dehydratase
VKVLVTGGAGFIGSHFVESVLNDTSLQVESLLVLDSLTYAGNLANLTSVQSDPRFQFIKGDIGDRVLTKQIINEVDFVFNFAAESHVDRSIESSKNFISTNVLGTANLLESALLNPEIVFIQISTDEVYGSVESGFSKETDVLLPNSPYSASKASADLICRAFATTHNLDIRITRSCNNFGTRQNEEKFIPTIISKIREGQPIPVYGNGSNVREWIHVLDNCSAIKKVAFQGQRGEIYNIGSGELMTNLEIVDLILTAFPETDSKVEFTEDRKGHDQRYALDNSKVVKELGFRCNFTLKNSLNQLIK